MRVRRRANTSSLPWRWRRRRGGVLLPSSPAKAAGGLPGRRGRQGPSGKDEPEEEEEEEEEEGLPPPETVAPTSRACGGLRCNRRRFQWPRDDCRRPDDCVRRDPRHSAQQRRPADCRFRPEKVISTSFSRSNELLAKQHKGLPCGSVQARGKYFRSPQGQAGGSLGRAGDRGVPRLRPSSARSTTQKL